MMVSFFGFGLTVSLAVVGQIHWSNQHNEFIMNCCGSHVARVMVQFFFLQSMVQTHPLPADRTTSQPSVMNLHKLHILLIH